MSFVLRMQWRLLLRNWAFWVVAAVGLLLTWQAATEAPPATLLWSLGESGFRMILVGQMLVTAALAQRERAERVQELIEALPYRPAVWVGGRFLASFLVWLGCSVLIWLTAGLTHAGQGLTVDWTGLGLHWLVTAPVTLAWSTAMGLVLGQVLSSALTAYLLLPVIWVVQTLLPMFVEGSMGYRAPAWMDFVPNDRFFPGASESYFTSGLLVLVNRLWHLSVAGLACIGLIWLGQRRRGMRALSAGLLAGACLAATIAGPIGWTWADGLRESAYAAERDSLPEHPARWPEPDTLRTDHYDLDVALAPDQHRLSAEGSFDVTNQSTVPVSELAFTLRSDLTVTSSSATYRREGDYLIVTMPLGVGETKRLTLSWEGEVWQWRRNGEGGPPLRLGAHISPESVFLPATYAWYPLPNRLLLAYRSTHPRPSTIVYEVQDLPVHQRSASFSVRVTGANLPLLHNAGPDVTGLYLISGPAPEPIAPGVEFSGNPANLAQARQFAEALSERAIFYESLVPRGGGPIRLVEVSTATRFGSSLLQEPDAAPGAILLWPTEYMSLLGAQTYAGRAGNMVTRLWWPRDRARGPGDRAVYDGLARYMEWARVGKEPPAGWESDSGEYQQALMALEQARGREAAVAVLRELYPLAQTDRLTKQAFEAAVQRAGGSGQ